MQPSVRRVLFCLLLLGSAYSWAANLSVTPITWDVKGLDSNDVNVGPNRYLVGVRVSNDGVADANNVTASLIWDTNNPYINIQPGSSSALSVPFLAKNSSTDFYFNVEITRNSSAYDAVREYHITVSHTGGATISTSRPRQIYVEKIISQARNGVDSIAGPTTVYVGNTYQYTVKYHTATGGYDQLEAFAYFPNILFQILSVNTTYSAPAGATNNKVYADAGGWDNDPLSASYKEIIGPNNYTDGKAGGSSITSIYTIKVLGTGTATVSNTINDHSGSSYHYNADYGTGLSSITITCLQAPADLAISKIVDNSGASVGSNVTFTLTVSNTVGGNNDATGIRVSDVLPAGFQFVSATPATGTYDSSTGLWSVPSLTFGNSTTLQITAKVVKTGVSTNTATILGADQNDPNNTNNSSSVNVGPPVPNAGLSLTSTSETHTSGSNLAIGEIARYRLEYKLSQGSTSNLQFEHTLPSNTTYLGNPKLALVSTTPGGGVYTVDLATTMSLALKSASPLTLDTELNSGKVDNVQVNGKIILVKDQPSPNDWQNGIYIGSGSGNNAVLTRVSTYVPMSGDFITETNDGTKWQLTTANPITLNTTPLTYVTSTATTPGIISSVHSGTGLIFNGNETMLDTVSPSFVMTAGLPVTATGTLLFTLGNMTNPDSDADFEFVVLEFNVLVNNVAGNTAGTSLNNSYRVTSPTTSTTLATSNTHTATVVEPSISGTKVSSAGPNGSPIGNGQKVTYTLNYVAASGGNTAMAHDAVITDTLPVGMTLDLTSVVVTTSGGVSAITNTSTGNTINLAASEIPHGSTIQVVYSASISSTVGTILTNNSLLTYTSLPGAGTAANATGTATPGTSGASNGERNGNATAPNNYRVQSSVSGIVTTSADLEVLNSVSNKRPNVNDLVTFTITVTNKGPDTALNVSLGNVLPAGLTWQSASSVTGTLNTVGNTTTWTIGSLTNGTTVTLTVTARVDSTLTQVDVATVTSTTFDPVIRNNVARASETPLEIDLVVTNTVDNATPTVGQNVVFTVTLFNFGPDNATSVTLTNALPFGLSYVSHTTSTGTFVSGTGVLAVGPLPVSTTTAPNIVTLTVTAQAVTTGTLTDTASATALEYDSNLANNTASVVVTPLAPPSAVNDSYSTARDVVLTVDAATGVLINDTLNSAIIASFGKTNGDEQTTIGGSTATAQNGTIVLSADGSFTYTPANGFSGTDSFKYIITNTLGSATATVTITVVAPPTAVNDSYSAVLNTALNVATATGVLNNDTLNSATIVSYGNTVGNEQTTVGGSTSTAQNGTVTLNADGSFMYTPAAGFVGSDLFKYIISNVAGSSTATVNFTVFAPPVAVNDSYSAARVTALTIPLASGVLNNDTLNSASLVSYGKTNGNEQTTIGASASTLQNGSVVLNTNGSFTYTPANGFVGTDSFKYIVSNFAGSSTATVTITVFAPPLAVNESYSAARDTALTVPLASGVLNNDTVNGATIVSFGMTTGSEQTSIGGSTQTVQNGSVTLNADGSFTYTPAAGFVGTDSFHYIISNVAGNSTATVTFTVFAPPVAVNDSYSAVRDTALTIPLATGVVNNDTLNSATIVSYGNTIGNEQTTIGVSTSTTQNGSAVLNADSSFTYTPANGFVGTDSFKYIISNFAGSSTATVTITVFAPPLAVDDSYSAAQDAALTVPIATGVLNNDTLNSATLISFGKTLGSEQITIGASTATAQNGTLTLNADGSFTYTPAAGFVGSDSFKYIISNFAGSSTATVTFTVFAPPVATNDSYVAARDTALVVGTATGILFNDTLNGAGIISFGSNGNEQATLGSSTPTAQGGMITLNADGSFTYSPPAGFTGTDTFKYIVSNFAGSSTATVTFTVRAPPVAVNDSYDAARNTALNIAAASGVLVNDTLNSATIVTYGKTNGNEQVTIGASTTTAQNGTVMLNANGSFTYTPAAGFAGTDTFKYIISNVAGSSTATVTLTVYAPPNAMDDSYSAIQDTPLTVGALTGTLLNDTLNGAVIVSFGSAVGNEQTAIGAPTPTAQGGSVTLMADGSFTYTPLIGFFGSDSFKYVISNFAGSSAGTVAITVVAPPVAVNDLYTAAQDSALTIAAASGVLDNDTLNGATIVSYGKTIGNEQLTIGASTTTDQNGTIVLNADGSFTYTPVNGFLGADSFKYIISNIAGSSTATVTINVSTLPVAVDDNYAAARNTALLIAAATGVLTNDSLNGATVLSYGKTTGSEQLTIGASTTTTQNGTILLDADGSFTYISAAGFVGTDSFKYIVSNLSGASTATVTITVFAPPVAVNDSYTTLRDTPLSEVAPGTLDNDTPNSAPIVSFGANGNEQTTIGASTPTAQSGSIVFNADGSFTYTPPAGFTGNDTFKYTLTNFAGSATATVTIGVVPPSADLQITKTNGIASAVPGGTVTYTITVINAGPSNVSGASVTDNVSAKFSSFNYTATQTGGATGFTANGSGNINDVVTMPAGSQIVYTATATISLTATGTLDNTASITAPVGVSDPDLTNNSSTDSDPLGPSADLKITKSDGVVATTPGSTVTYTITVTNAGPSVVAGATITDTFSGSFTSVSYTATGTGGSSGFAASGSGNINHTVNMPVLSTIVYTATATISLTATGTLQNTASVAPPVGTTDPNTTNNSETDSDALGPVADLQITKTDGAASAVPGTAITYTIVVTNAGPANVTGATITDTMPAGLINVTFTTSGTGGAAGFANGSGSISQTVNMPAGSTITYLVSGTVSSTATGTLANTASVTLPGTVTDTDLTNNTATDTTTLTPQADLQITKTNGSTSQIPGAAVTYTIVVTNIGPSAVTGAIVSDTMPAGLTNVTYTTSGTGGAAGFANGSGNINQTVNMPAASTITYVVSATVSAAATVNLVNTASVTPPVGVTDPNNGNNSATDDDTLTPSADLHITKTDGAGSSAPGSVITYTIVVTNAGPSNIVGATVSDTMPPALTNVSYTASGTAGAANFAAGTGNINQTVNMPAESSITYVVTATISASATGSLANTATATVPVGVNDPNNGNNTSTDTNTLTPTADLQITKTDGVNSVSPGSVVIYTITVSNPGPSNVIGATVADTFPAALNNISFTAVQSGGASGFSASGNSNINEVVSMPAGSTITYTASATLSGSATGSLANAATITPPVGVTDPNGGNNTSTDTDSIGALADLEVIAIVNNATPTVGQTVTVTLTLTNKGPSTANNIAVTNILPAGLTFVLSSQASYNPGIGDNIWDVPTLALDSSVMLTIDVVVTSTAALTSTAQVTSAGELDPDSVPGNNNPAEDDQSSVTITGLANPQSADLALTKVVDKPVTKINEPVVFTISLVNNGPADATGIQVSDLLPAGLTLVSANASQGTYSSTTGLWNVGSVGTGSNATLLITATLTMPSSLTNVAQILAADQQDPVPDNNIATATVRVPIADLSIVETVTPTTVLPGDVVTLTVTVSNAGPEDANGVELTYRLPTGVKLLTTATTIGTFDSQSGIWTIGDIPFGTSVTLTLTAEILMELTSLTTSSQITSSNQWDPDSTPNNSNPIEDDEISTTIVTRPLRPVADMTSVCFGAKFNFRTAGRDALLLVADINMPKTFVAAGQPLKLNVDGWQYSCILDSRGICRDGGVSTRLRYRRNAWNLTVKARTDLRSMRVAQDEDVASPRASDVRVIMELNDEAFIMTPSTLYLSRQGHAGKVFGTP